MDIKEKFYDWLVANYVRKASKAREIVNVIALADEKCVMTKGDGQYSILNYTNIKTAKYINDTFLKPKLLKKDLGKSIGLFEKNIHYLFEFFETLTEADLTEPSAEAIEPVEPETAEPNEPEVTESNEPDQAVDSISVSTEDAAAAEEADEIQAQMISKETALVEKVNEIASLVVGNISLAPVSEKPMITEDACVYFDLINAQMGIQSNNKITMRGMAEIYLENDKHHDKNDSVFLEDQRLLSVYQEIYEAEKTEVIKSSIQHSLKDIRTGYRGLYAMIPDVLDEFAKETRSQLNYKGEQIFPIPRSIAYTLGYQDSLIDRRADFADGEEIVFADYDGESFTAIQLEAKKDDSADYAILVRKGLKKVKTGHPSYNDLFDFCIDEYSKAHKIKFEESTKKYLRESKAFASLFSTGKPILLKQSSGYIRLEYDKNIHTKAVKRLEDDAYALSEELRLNIDNIVIGSCFNQNHNAELIGCYTVWRRIHKQLPLWREYLPRLSLEVIENGRYSEIELIKDDEYRDVLKTIGEEEIIPVDGTLTFSEGKALYSLPLERSIENDINKEKQCVFKHPAFPLKSSVEVSLEVHYKYGDENSYKLVAKPKNTKKAPFDRVESEWIDREELPLGKVSKFVSTGGMLPRKYEGCDDVENVTKAFDAFATKLQKAYNDYDRNWRIRQITTKRPDGSPTVPSFLWELHRYFASRRRVFNMDSYNCDLSARNLINSIKRSDALNDLFNVAKEHASHNSYFSSLVGSKMTAEIRDKAREILADMGVIYELYSLDNIVDYYIELKKIRYLAVISRCLTDDRYGVFEAIADKICDDGLDQSRLRTLGSNCSYTKDWAKNLYNTPNGPQALAKIRDYVIDLIMRSKLGTEKYNPLEVRDYMELLVCICPINEIDINFIDPNDKKIKKLVKKLKEMDDIINEHNGEFTYNNKNGQTTKPFRCRLMTQNMEKKELYGMHDLTYMLVQILTGAESINLTGFVDDD